MEQQDELNTWEEATRTQRRRDEKGPKKPENNKATERKDRFEYIADEIRRQHEVVSKVYESLDTKIGVILAFIFVVLTQLAFRPELTGLAAKNVVLFSFFLFGLGAVIASIVMGMIGLFFIGLYDIGPQIADLVDEYKAGKDLNQVISKGITNAIEYDIERTDRKGEWLKRMLIALIIGLFTLVALEACYTFL